MDRVVNVALLLSLFIAAPAVIAGAGPETIAGTYSGRAQERAGPNWSDIDLTIKEVSADGRISAIVQAFRAGPTCGRPLPMNGQMKDGAIRLEVKEGAPSGCERTYELTLSPDGGLVGTSVYGGKTFDLQFKRR
jgi:hypothetical protein